MKKHSQQQTKWNLAPLLASDNDSSIDLKQQQIQKANQTFVAKWKSRTDYLTDALILKEALDEYENLLKNYGTGGDISYYFQLRSSQDENSPELKARLQKIHEFSQKLGNEIQFFTLHLSHIDPATQQKLLANTILTTYKHYLEKLFVTAKYLLSEKEERIVTLKTLPSYHQWVQMTAGLLSQEERELVLENGQKKTIPFAAIPGYMRSKNKTVRDHAATALNDILAKHISVAEAEMNAILTNKKIDDELRGFDRPDRSRHLADDIETDIVDTLIATVSSSFEISKKYYALKAKLLGVKKLEYHERNVEYGTVTKTYSYEQTCELVHHVFNSLDPEFATILRTLSSNGNIDAFPYKGKRSGAFCIHHLITQPTYVLLNHTDKLSDVLTFAHELGHAINNELMRKKQNAITFDSPTSTAEVASTFMEDFVLQYLLKEADDELKLSLMMLKLDSDISTIFRQISFYRFEQQLHAAHKEKGYLSHTAIGDIFRNNMEAYMGESVKQSNGSENWWVYVPHFRYFFYVYSYASGLLISKSLQAAVKKDHTFISKVKDFLSAGESASPKEIFLKLGINITDRSFWQQGLTEVEDLLAETTELAKKLQKM